MSKRVLRVSKLSQDSHYIVTSPSIRISESRF
jgi:hypothetical protein